MSKDVDLRTVLAPFLKCPSRSFSREDLRPILKNMSADPIQKALQKLENDKILDVEFSRGRPKGGMRKKNYKLSSEISVFENLFQLYSKDDIEELLASEYTNSLIEHNNLSIIYNIIKSELEITNFRRTASEILLGLPSTKREYNDKTKFIEEFYSIYRKKTQDEQGEVNPDLVEEKELSELVIDRPRIYAWDSNEEKIEKRIECVVRPVLSKRIEILKDFDSIEAVCLYRSTMHKEIRKLFSDLFEKSFITRGLSKFMEYDNYLSPFTSYPINFPQVLIFSHPFQRIYDDVYLLSKKDLSKICGRALTIYNNFADLLFEHFRNQPPPLDTLELWTKQFIFQWNTINTNFDNICNYLQDLYRLEIGSGIYHVYTEGPSLKVRDLEKNKLVPEDYQEIIFEEGGIWEPINPPFISHLFAGLETDIHDPYTDLIPCSWFRDLKECPDYITYERILVDLKSKFAKYGLYYDEIERT